MGRRGRARRGDCYDFLSLDADIRASCVSRVKKCELPVPCATDERVCNRGGTRQRNHGTRTQRNSNRGGDGGGGGRLWRRHALSRIHARLPLDGAQIEERFLAVLSIALACAVCALCVLVMLLTALVHKLSTLWVKALVRPAASTEPSDDPRKGLLQEETKSCLRDASASDDKQRGQEEEEEDQLQRGHELRSAARRGRGGPVGCCCKPVPR